MRGLIEAAWFAAERHRGQRRKDVVGTPYIYHPLGVAEILVREGGVEDLVILQAALLHDVLEDTATSAGELAARFGDEVCGLVVELTDDMSLPLGVRRRVQMERVRGLSVGARLIRVADKIYNVGDVTGENPVGWSRVQKEEYLEWAAEVVGGCAGVCAGLEREFGRVLAVARGHLG
ncbi:MAG: guanosine-3,5-bis(diphosphate) 3-pyrophosphohydrolase [Verrucomicrobiota bacterium]|jgi:guanosine-3',5'-bis(diphosphate) 3'-pyrophosphohydrolase